MENPTVTEILKSTLISIIRHGLSILAAYLITKGILSPELASESNLIILAGGIATGIVSLTWIVYQKLKTHRLIASALAAPPGTSMGAVKANAAAEPLLGN